MDSFDGIPEQALAWHRAGVGAVLATVTQTWGSAPRRPGGDFGRGRKRLLSFSAPGIPGSRPCTVGTRGPGRFRGPRPAVSKPARRMSFQRGRLDRSCAIFLRLPWTCD